MLTVIWPNWRRVQCARIFWLALVCSVLISISLGQGAKQVSADGRPSDPDADHVHERDEWFYRGRVVRGLPSAELRRRAFESKLRLRAQRAAALPQASQPLSFSSGSWVPLGPVGMPSDASGNGTQDYHQVAGRATAVAIDPADPSGNTIYIGGAQSGVWKSTNAANSVANDVTWTPVTDDQATLSIGAIAIQPGNSDPAKTLILAATGEANSSSDSYFGLGILRSTDGGNSWILVTTANAGTLSFSGLGGTRMAFSTANGQTSTVVAAMGTSSEGLVDGAVTSATKRGLYTSVDAGQSWTYDAPSDPGGAIDATSATSVVYNEGAKLFFAGVRYHGFYSSPDGITWTRLASQPGGVLLSTTACPPQSASNNYGCPIYRAELTAIPARNEMYAWYVYLSATGDVMDGGIWQSLNGGGSWTAISDAGITNCGDSFGCGVQQGTYNLALTAMADGSSTDLYAGAVNLYKCAISVLNPTCSASPFINLTHVYGCSPIAAPSHVHPDQHALAALIPTSGSDSGNALLYMANDGGIYRVLDGYHLSTNGTCSDVNAFDDLNQNLGSMAQFVSFSQHPTDANTMLGGTQDNGSPATANATTSSIWVNVLGGDGGYNAIDPQVVSDFYATNPDVPPQGLGIQLCSSGIYCNNSGFSFVVTSSGLGGDDGGFYFPFVLDPGSSTSMLVGTCRVWRGPRTGGAFTALSPNFDSLGSGSCSGNEVNQVRAVAAAGKIDSNGSGTVYATTSGLGPLGSGASTPGGRVWVTTDATSGPAAFVDVTDDGPGGNINPSQFPISGVAIDPLDVSGKTAYVTLMGFTGGTGHVWKTTNAGASWTDFTANLPDSPTNAVLVYAPMSEVFVATDLGVFASPTSAANWTELGPAPGSGQIGFLPNVAVTALGIFNYGGQQLLRASTYGRGMWQFNLLATPDFQLSLSNPSQTISAGQTANFSGSASALNGYASSVALSCVSGITAPPPTCTLSPSALTPGRSTPFTVTAGGSTGDYYFNVQGKGSDSNHVTHQIAAALHVTGGTSDFTLSGPASPPIANAGGSTTISNAISVTATSGFQGVIALTCSVDLANGAAANATCSTAPGTVTSIPSQVNVTVDSTNLSANQNATDGFKLVIKGSSGSITHTLVIPFNVGDYGLSGPPSLTAPLGGQVTENVNIAASAYYGGKINATCDASSLPGAICNLSPVNPVPVNVGATVQLVATINVPASASAGATYKFNINTQDTTGVPSHSFTFSLNAVQNFSITPSPTTQTVSPGGITSSYNLTVAPVQGAFTGAVAFSCLGLPAGAGCAFNPPTVTPGSSSATVAMTISTAIATIANSYTVTVLATSGSLSNSVPVTLVVSKDFQVTLVQDLPANATGGQTVSALVNLNPNYSGSVNAYCDSTTIAGSTCTIAPVNPVLLSASVPMQLAVTLKLPNNAAPGSYPVNLKATDSSGLPSHSQSLSLTITDFSVTSSTASQTVSTGQTTGPYQLTIAPNPSGSSFSGAVTLSCGAGLPTGAQCVFNPSTPVTPGSSAVDVVMSIATGTATPAGTYNVSVTGTSGTLVHASAVDLVVTNNGTGNAPDFQLVITQPFPASVAAGSSQVAKVSLTPSYSGAVNANCDASAIPGAQCTITPQSPISISANQPSVLAIALNLPNTAVPGTYNVNVEVADSGGEPSHSLQLPIAVIADFSVSSSTPSQTVTAGQTSGAYQLTVAPNPPGSSFSGAVTLSCAGLPTGGQCIFQPAGPVTPGTSAVDVVMNISTSKDTVESQSVQADVFPLAAIWMPLAIFIVGTSVAGKRTWKNPSTWLGCLTCFLALMMLMSCAGVSSAGGGGGQSPPSTTYHVTITGTSPGTPVDAGQSTTVTLVVN